MPTDDNESLLSLYDDCITSASYRGEGTLILEDKQTGQCVFEAGQLKNGDVLLICNCTFSTHLFFISPYWVDSFKGTTSQGFIVSADKHIMEVNYLPELDSSRFSMGAAFYVRELTVQIAEGSTPQSVHFGITNFMCISDLSLRLESATDMTTLLIKRVEEYSRITSRLQVLKGIDVTCEVIAQISTEDDIGKLEQVIDDLCYLLSVARGTKTQWIYCDQYDGTGKRIARRHASRVTKAYTSYAPISPQHDEDTKTFIERTYSVYVTRRELYNLNGGTIDAYLDAKLEHDFLQMRGVKLAVAMEMLKAVFLKLPDASSGEYILDENLFHNLKPTIKKAIRDILTSAGVENAERGAIYKKLTDINRRSFKEVLVALFKHINLAVSEEDMDLFVKCRDKLVHTGSFYGETASSEVREKYKQLSSLFDEYLFLVSFLDKIFLKLLGYSGPYIDLGSRERPRRNLS